MNEAVDAVLAVGPDSIPSGVRPLAVWVDSVDDLGREKVAAAEVVLSGRDDVVARAASTAFLVPAGMPAGADPSPDRTLGDAVPVAPFVRARLRAARGLPDPLVITHDGAQWTWGGAPGPLGADLGRTSVGCASAAIVAGPALLGALAWGTPSVTDRDTAARFGACPNRDVLVAEGVNDRRRAAVELAADYSLAARLSWAGRRLVETHHSPATVAAALVRRLGLGDASRFAVVPGLAAALGELGTPVGAAIVERVRVAGGFLAMAPPGPGA